MQFQRFESILDECLLALEQGQSVNDCLARHPKYAERLEPLLRLAGRVQHTPAVAPRPEAQAIAWIRVRQRATELRRGRQGFRPAWDYGAWLRPVAVAAALVGAFMLAGGATAAAAQNALPSSPLYRVKLATEDARLWIVFDETREAGILLDQSDKRIEEIDAMQRQGEFISSNVLSVLRNRNERAAAILLDHPEEAGLQEEFKAQMEDQEQFLIGIPGVDLSESGRSEYAEAVASVHNTRLEFAGGSFVSIRPEDLAGGIQQITGPAEQIEVGLWEIGGIPVRIDDRTIGTSGLKPGATARFVLAVNSRGDLRALSLSTIEAWLPSSDAVVSGKLEELTDAGARIGGQLVPLSSQERRKLEGKVGQNVGITIETNADGVDTGVVAQPAANTLTFEGTVEGVVRDGDWKIGGLVFVVPDSAPLDLQAGKAQVGSRVLVEAAANTEGVLVAQGVTVLATDAPAESVYIVGAFEGSTEGVWNIGGIQVVPPSTTTPDPELESVIAINARRDREELLATQFVTVEKPGDAGVIRLSGAILDISGSQWTLDFGLELGKVRATSTAEVSGKPLIGARVLVWGRQGKDDTVQAFYARVFDKTPVIATPIPTPVPTPTP